MTSDSADLEVIALMNRSIEDWCKANQSLIDELESSALEGKKFSTKEDKELSQNKAELSAHLFKELSQLGLLNILIDNDQSKLEQVDIIKRSNMMLVAEAAYQFARFSPSIALMLVQQNMASYLLSDAPSAWVALPLYDAVSEWSFQLTLKDDSANSLINSEWKSIPLLPNAEFLLLPVCGKNSASFKLLEINLKAQTSGTSKVISSGQMLGLRACEFGDLELKNFRLSNARILRQGDVALEQIERLWSQAEVFMMAIRSGIFESTYIVARDYAKARWQGGKYIIDHSLIRKMLADLYQDKCALYESWQSILTKLDTSLPLNDGQMGSALKSGERLPWAASDGIQLLGGNGYMEDYNQARCFRDSKQCEFLLGHPQARRFTLWQKELSA